MTSDEMLVFLDVETKKKEIAFLFNSHNHNQLFTFLLFDSKHKLGTAQKQSRPKKNYKQHIKSHLVISEKQQK